MPHHGTFDDAVNFTPAATPRSDTAMGRARALDLPNGNAQAAATEPAPPTMPATEPRPGSGDVPGPPKPVVEVALLFLRLGLTAFGGPAAHIAMLEDEVVRRRKWVTSEEFLDLLGATNLIPGPNSTELAIHLGHRRAGWLGWAVGGLAFILPAMLLVMGIAWAYVRFGNLPRAEGLLLGVKPVILVVILQALTGLGRKAVKNRMLGVAGLAAAGLVLAGADELVVLFGTGAAVTLASRLFHGGPTSPGDDRAPRRNDIGAGGLPLAAAAGVPTALAGAAATSAFGLAPLFWVFLKIGSVLFGSGYVLLAFMQADLVDARGWLTEAQLVDAIAVGQFTPGPIFTAATFVGFLLDGVPGALVATAGIFLPAFVFVALSGPLVPRLRASRVAGWFLDGVNVASLALMAVVALQLGRLAITNVPTAALAIVSGVLLFRYRVNSAWLVLGGALVGLATN